MRFAQLLGVGCLALPVFQANTLRSPWQDIPTPPATSAASYRCPPNGPQLPRTLSFDGYYTDAHHSIRDETALRAYRSAAAVPEDFSRDVARAAGDYRLTGSQAAARCAVDLLASAARQRAFTDAQLGHQHSRQAFYVQTWLCAGLSLAYLKVENTPAENAVQHAAITAWLANLGQRVRAFQNGLASKGTTDSRNNHRYWAGLAVAAAGIATNRRDLFDWGVNAGRDGLRQITPDGTLPLEMNRAALALHYHLFAAAPLVLLAELGKANGIDLYDEDGGALRRLVLRAASGLLDPAFFVKHTGVTQDPQKLSSGATIAWAAPFARRFPDPALNELLAGTTEHGYSMFGGMPPP